MTSSMRLLLLIALCGLTAALGIKLIRFGGGGMYFWWQAGAAQYILEQFDLHDVSMLGESAGSLVAALLACRVPFDNAAEVAIRIANENQVWDKKLGLAGIWGPMVKEWLEEVLPHDIDRDTLDKIHVRITPLLVFKGTKLVSNFSCRSDLIESLMASIHIPLFMDGHVFYSYDGRRYIDGSFVSFMTKRPTMLPKLFRDLDKDRDILRIEQKMDEAFMKSMKDKSIVKLISPTELHSMMKHGYNYMQDLDRQNKVQIKLRS